MITDCDLVEIETRGGFILGLTGEEISFLFGHGSLLSLFFGCLVSGFLCYISKVAFGSPYFADFLFYGCLCEFAAF